MRVEAQVDLAGVLANISPRGLAAVLREADEIEGDWEWSGAIIKLGRELDEQYRREEGSYYPGGDRPPLGEGEEENQ